MKQRYFLAIIIVLVGSSGLYNLGSKNSDDIVLKNSSQPVLGQSANALQANARGNLAESNANSSSAETTTRSIASIADYKASPELGRYDLLKQKVFLTEEERMEKAILLHDERLFRSLKTLLLLDSSSSRTLQADQDRALDLLYEAIEIEESPAALEVLNAIVADTQIENPNLSPATRENLAGIKGEVIYHWTSLHPERSSDVEALLPGPASKRIFENVRRLQDVNHTESKGELAGSY